MEIKVLSANIAQVAADAIVIDLFENETSLPAAAREVDKALQGAISQLLTQKEIRGKLGEVLLLHTLGKIPSSRVALVGLGKKKELTPDKVRRASADVARALRKAGAARVATVAHGAGVGGIALGKAAQCTVEGCLLGLYLFQRHKTKDPETREIKEITLVEKDSHKIPALEKGAFLGRVMAEATNLARDMGNEPANFMTPTHLAQQAMDIARTWGLEVSVLEREEMRALGMGGLLGVAQGSEQPPKFIVLRYKGDPASSKTLGFVGKAITFDSGGISLKPSEGMAEMKSDMSGGAAVLAALGAIAQLKLKINVTALVGATENLPSGAALKPGDIVKAVNGKTIEIISTDAEGRLTLADVLGYARKQGISPIVELATLTGACHVALGDYCSGAFTNNQELVERVVKAGEESGECHWQMPMMEEYKEQNKSDVADIKNVGGRFGGAITAALFLAEFAEDTPWVHLDIAGTARIEKDMGYLVKGATGVGVRTLINLALAVAAK